MPQTTVNTPNGQITVSHPEGATDEQILRFAKSQVGAAPSASPPAASGNDSFVSRLPPHTQLFLRGLVGTGEVAGQLGSSIAAEHIAGLRGLAATAIPGGMSGPEAVNQTRDALTFQPGSEQGQALGGAISKPFAALEDLADRAGEKAGNPIASTAIKTLLLGGPTLLGLRSGTRAAASNAVQKARNVPPPVPTVAELFQRGNQAFRRVDDAGVTVNAESSFRLADRISDRLIKEGLDDVIHPESSQAVRRILERTDGEMSFQQLDTLRKIAADARKSQKPADARLAGIVVKEIDEFIDNLDSSSVSGGNAGAAASAIKEARSLWSRARKGEQIDDLIDRAGVRAGQFSGSGFENALRTEFRQLALNKKKIKLFTNKERAAIRKVAMGGPVGNTLRALGKFAPRGVVSTAVSVGGGSLLGGPVGSFLVPLLGEAGRAGATRATIANARRASEVVRAGR